MKRETPELSLPPWRCGLCGENHRTLAAGAVLSSGSNSFKCLVLLVEDAGFSLKKKIQNPQYLKKHICGFNAFCIHIIFIFNLFFIKTISFDSYPSYPEFVTSILEARGTTFGVQGYAATLAAVPQTSIHQGSGEDSRVYGWSNLPLTVAPPGTEINKNPITKASL